VAELASLLIGDPADLWASLGFAVDDDGDAHVAGVRHMLGGLESGLRDWAFRDLADGVNDIDGVKFGIPSGPPRPTPAHPNGVIGLDHLVLSSPDLDRTIASFESAGIELRRVRETGTDERPMRQAFFRTGPVILELVGPRVATGDGPLRFFGLAWTVRDIEETAAYLGDRLRPAKDAVQPGRRIATLDRAAGSTVSMAFMSGEPD